MYPIVFNLNESYVPYASVLMTSIINKRKTSKPHFRTFQNLPLHT